MDQIECGDADDETGASCKWVDFQCAWQIGTVVEPEIGTVVEPDVPTGQREADPDTAERLREQPGVFFQKDRRGLVDPVDQPPL